jgi:hypothetical protein
MALATIQQDQAAGGIQRRKMRIRSGEIFTVSLAVAGTKSPYRLTLRFKNGGTTIQRPVGPIDAESSFEALKLGWTKIREDRFVDQFGWSWVNP